MLSPTQLIRRRPLRQQLIGTYVFLLLAFSLFVLFYFPSQQQRQLENALNSKLVRLTEGIAIGTGVSLETGNNEFINGIARWARDDPDLACILVVDETLEPIVDFNTEALSAPAAQLLATSGLSRSADLTVYVAPIASQAEPLGHVLVGMSRARLNQEIQQTRLTALLMTLIVCAVGTGIGWMLSGLIAKPLASMTRVAEQLAEGDTEVTVDAVEGGEIGSLAAAFTSMQDNLRRLSQQARRIADGDLSQHLTMKGDLAQAFNRMQQNLEQRLTQLQHEIAERERAEGDRDRFFNVSLDMFCIASFDGYLKMLNPAWEDILGYSREELLAQPYLSLVHDEDLDETVRMAKKLARGQSVLGFENRFVCKDGSRRWFQWNAVPYREARIAYATARDITQQKFVEEQLAQARKLESIGQLAAGVAHEINTPMQFIGDNAQFLEEAFEDIMAVMERIDRLLSSRRAGQPAEAELQALETLLEEIDFAFIREGTPEALQATREGIRRVSRIIRAMREFSHPGSGDKEPTDINNMIENVATISRNEWKYIADLDLDLDPTLPAVPCLAGELSQVIVNMVVNASHAIADAVAEGERGKITVTSRHRGQHAEIRIADTGKGIPDGIKEQIFDPFFTTKEVGKGTGQGLAICRNVIVNQHGGEIHVDSASGEGTCFTIRLPLEGAPAISLSA